MTTNELRARLVESVAVTRADIVAAKAHLMLVAAEHVETVIQNAAEGWAGVVSPGERTKIFAEQGDLEQQIRVISKGIAAILAFSIAANELTQAGVLIAGGARAGWQPNVEYRSSRAQMGLGEFKELQTYFPERVTLPAWHREDWLLTDGDLYLERIGDVGHPGIAQALRISLECFRAQLHVPCVAMLGAASEGAWLELGAVIAPHAHESLAKSLESWRVSTKEKIGKVCDAYRSLASLEGARRYAGVDGLALARIAEWSDLVREARNVLHWNAKGPTAPNSYEKVATVLMAAAEHLSTLNRARQAVPNLNNPPS